MGIFSRKRGRHHAESRSLVHTNEESPELREVEEAAEADVARVRQDDKYFGPDAPANQDEKYFGQDAPAHQDEKYFDQDAPAKDEL